VFGKRENPPVPPLKDILVYKPLLAMTFSVERCADKDYLYNNAFFKRPVGRFYISSILQLCKEKEVSY
jgi:hypothetical protein